MNFMNIDEIRGGSLLNYKDIPVIVTEIKSGIITKIQYCSALGKLTEDELLSKGFIKTDEGFFMILDYVQNKN